MTSIQGQQELEQRGWTGMNQWWQSRNWAFHLCIGFANKNLKKCLFQKIQTFPTASSRRSASFCSAAALPQLQNVSTPVAQLTSFVSELWVFELSALSLIIFSLNTNTDHISQTHPLLYISQQEDIRRSNAATSHRLSKQTANQLRVDWPGTDQHHKVGPKILLKGWP